MQSKVQDQKPAPYLPPELLEDIFLRLKHPELCRTVKRVCLAWYNVASGPKFRHHRLPPTIWQKILPYILTSKGSTELNLGFRLISPTINQLISHPSTAILQKILWNVPLEPSEKYTSLKNGDLLEVNEMAKIFFPYEFFYQPFNEIVYDISGPYFWHRMSYLAVNVCYPPVASALIRFATLEAQVIGKNGKGVSVGDFYRGLHERLSRPGPKELMIPFIKSIACDCYEVERLDGYKWMKDEVDGYKLHPTNAHSLDVDACSAAQILKLARLDFDMDNYELTAKASDCGSVIFEWHGFKLHMECWYEWDLSRHYSLDNSGRLTLITWMEDETID